MQKLISEVVSENYSSRSLYQGMQRSHMMAHYDDWWCHEISTYSDPEAIWEHWNFDSMDWWYVLLLLMHHTCILVLTAFESQTLRALSACLRSCPQRTWMTSAVWWKIPSSPWNCWQWSASALRCLYLQWTHHALRSTQKTTLCKGCQQRDHMYFRLLWRG